MGWNEAFVTLRQRVDKLEARMDAEPSPEDYRSALKALVEAVEAIPRVGGWGRVGQPLSDAVIQARALLPKEGE